MSAVNMQSMFVMGVLYVLAALAAHALLERLIFHFTHQLVHPRVLSRMLRHWKTHRRVELPANEVSLGWFGPLVHEGKFDLERVWELACRKRDSILRHQNVLPTLANVATATGLLAGVIALVHSAGSEGGAAIGLGMYGTMLGLMIAIPVNLFLGLSHGRVNKLAEQADAIIDVLEKLRDDAPPMAILIPAPPPPQVEEPDNSEIKPKRVVQRTVPSASTALRSHIPSAPPQGNQVASVEDGITCIKFTGDVR